MNFLKSREWLQWIICIFIAILLALIIRYFIGTPTTVKSISMEPTLIEGEKLLLNRIAIITHQIPKRGEIITFEAPDENSSSLTATYYHTPTNLFAKFFYYILDVNKTSYIKRVIALPGDHVVITDGKVFVNDEELQEEYLPENTVTKPQNSILTDFIVPEGTVFAMGDNREFSNDCRKFGCIPFEKIESIVWIRFWPFSKFGTIN